MKRHLLKTMVAVLAIAASAIAPARGQNATTYNVTFGGFYTPNMNTTVNVASLPQTFTAVGVYDFYPYRVISNGSKFTSASVTSGGDGKVSANKVAWNQITITVTGTFEGTATIHVVGSDSQENAVSCDITVACAVPPVPITVRMAAGTEEAANWSIASGGESVPGTQVLENVMSGSQVTATYNGTTKKVKSVKAVKYVAPAATVTTAPTATETYIEAGTTAALVNAGAANGGTMMYAVTTTSAQPASTADFSATRPTAEGRAAGTYYVWFYAKADADHSDSEIAGPVPVTLAVITTVTWNSSNIGDLQVMSTFISYTKEGITLSANANQNYAEWQDYGDESMNGISFQANQSGGFTFTAPTGKKFIKIEMTPNNSGGWEGNAGLGTGWAYAGDFDPMTMNMICKVTWTGSAASTVGLLTGAGNFGGEAVKSIVFTLIDAQ